MGYFGVIDTETNWFDQVMSIGAVIGDEDTLRPAAARYYIFPEEAAAGGMYESVLLLDTPVRPIYASRTEAMADLGDWLTKNAVTSLFAYNAGFDKNHLPELRDFSWFDIMRIAIYRQNNPKIPDWADCFSTGRMKRNYGVEPMLRLLSGNGDYRETHNALFDALDELEIIRLLEKPITDYIPL